MQKKSGRGASDRRAGLGRIVASLSGAGAPRTGATRLAGSSPLSRGGGVGWGANGLGEMAGLDGSGRRAGVAWTPMLLALACGLVALLGLLAAASADAALPASFGTEGSGAGQISANPEGIAVDQESGDVYVGDRNNNRVEKFGPEGEFLLAWGWGVADGAVEAQTCGPQAAPPTATCQAGIEGTGAGQFGSFGPEGIAVDNSSGPSAGDVYVIDPRDARVEKFGPAGNFILAFGEEGTGPGQFEPLGGRSIAVGATGTVYVGDRNRVQLFSESGVVQSEVALPATGRTINLAVDSTGDIYRVSGELEGVHRYNAAGVELGAPRDEGGIAEGLAISVGSANELFLNDFRGVNHILIYAPEGEQIASFDPGGIEQNGSRGIAYSEVTQALYILNEGKVRIVIPPAPGPFVLPGSEAATAITPTTAALGASLNPEGGKGTTYHFEYGTAAGVYTGSTPLTTLPIDEIQKLTLTATEGTFTLSFEGDTSAPVPFDAEAAELQAALEALASIGAGNVAVTGPAGGPYAIEFVGALAEVDVPELTADASGLGDAGEPGAATVTTTRPGGRFLDRLVSAPITGLSPRTTYHYRVVATNAAAETTVGPDQSFETLPPVSILSTSSSGVTASSATLGTELDPNGRATTYHFEYDIAPYAEGEGPHGISTPSGSAGSGETAVLRSAQIQGLQPLTTYHFRVVAENSFGVTVGEDRTLTTQGAPASVLPDNRVWEMVTPPNKFGSPLEPITEEGGLIQAAADGSAFTEIALGPLGPQAQGVRSPSDSQWLSHRSPSGWTTEDITTPREEISSVEPGRPAEYHWFASDLSSEMVEPQGSTPLSPLAAEKTPYRRETNGEFVPLLVGCPAPPQPCPSNVAANANVPPGTEFGAGNANLRAQFTTATADLAHVVLISLGVSLTDTPGDQGGSYELSGSHLTLLSFLPNGEPSAATLNAGNTPGDISADGSRVVLTGNGNHIYLRQNSTAPQSGIDGSGHCTEPDRACTIQLDVVHGGSGGSANAVFQGASADDSKIFFTDTANLTAGASAKEGHPDLYMCEVGLTAGEPTCALSDLSVTVNPGEAASVRERVSAIAASGSHVYFAANGVLTSTPNAHGEVAVPGACEGGGSSTCNLYDYNTDSHQIQLVAVLASQDRPVWGGNARRGIGNLTARSSPDGDWFTFMSRRPLTGYDNRDASSGQPDEEVFQFDSRSGRLRCISCNPTGARPHGVFDKSGFPGLLVDHPGSWGGEGGVPQWLAASIPGWTLESIEHAQYQSRFLSDSGREFFTAADALVPADTNGVMDVYEYEPPGVGDCTTSSSTYGVRSGGCVSLISSGTSPEESAFLDASENGNDVFFLTRSRLASTDVDNAFDVYDAAVDGSTHETVKPVECSGDACQQPVLPPNDATPGSLTFNGAGNVVQCPKGKVKQKGKCVKKKQQKKSKKHKKHHRKSNNKKGKKQKNKRTASHKSGGGK